MKNLIIIAIALLLAQNVEAQKHNYYTDYTSWLNPSDEEGVYTTQYKGKDLVARKYSENGDLAWEIIRLEGDRFLFYNHDEDAKNGLVSGELIIQDTAYSSGQYNFFNDSTSKVEIGYLYKRPLIKDGEWHEKNDTFNFHGSYKNGVRVGKWLKEGCRDPYLTDNRELTYENGKIINRRQLNFLKTNNRDTILHHICQTWYSSGKMNDLFVYFNNHKEKNMKMVLSPDGTLSLQSYPNGTVKSGEWYFKDGFEYLVLKLKYETFTFELDELNEKYLKLTRKRK